MEIVFLAIHNRETSFWRSGNHLSLFLKVLSPWTSEAKAAETLEATGQSYEEELKKAIQARTQKDSLFEGFFTSRKVCDELRKWTMRL